MLSIPSNRVISNSLGAFMGRRNRPAVLPKSRKKMIQN